MEKGRKKNNDVNASVTSAASVLASFFTQPCLWWISPGSLLDICRKEASHSVYVSGCVQQQHEPQARSVWIHRPGSQLSVNIHKHTCVLLNYSLPGLYLPVSGVIHRYTVRKS